MNFHIFICIVPFYGGDVCMLVPTTTNHSLATSNPYNPRFCVVLVVTHCETQKNMNSRYIYGMLLCSKANNV